MVHPQVCILPLCYPCYQQAMLKKALFPSSLQPCLGIQGLLQCSLPSAAPEGPKLLCQAGAKHTIRHPSFPSSPFWSLANSVRYDRFLFANPASRLEIDISVSLLHPFYLTAFLPMISPCHLATWCFSQSMH